MAKLTRAERIEIALIRLLRVLGNHTLATMRTLEMKISDAGPFDQRINPHILTEARDAMVEEGVLQRWQAAPHRPSWFYLGNAPKEKLVARYTELSAIQEAYSAHRFSARVGQALEIEPLSLRIRAAALVVS